jgi:hypothetical protein
MALVQYDYVKRIKKMIRDDAKKLDSGDFEIREHLAQAVKTYQKLRPYERLWEFTSTGASDNPVPDDWKEKFSDVMLIEYPIRESGQPEYLKGTEWEVKRTTTGYVLRFYYAIPSGKKANIIYTTHHILNDTQSTIYEADFDALCSLTASLACGSLAQYYAQSSNPTINADVTDYEDKGRIYAERAEVFMKAFTDHMAEWECEFPEMDIEGQIYREPIFHSSERL